MLNLQIIKDMESKKYDNIRFKEIKIVIHYFESNYKSRLITPKRNKFYNLDCKIYSSCSNDIPLRAKNALIPLNIISSASLGQTLSGVP